MRSVIEEYSIQEILPLIIETPPDLKSKRFFHSKFFVEVYNITSTLLLLQKE